jgi:hypothetical protein
VPISNTEVREKDILIGSAADSNRLFVDHQFVLNQQTFTAATDMANSGVHLFTTYQ